LVRWQDSIKLTVADFLHPEGVVVLALQFTMEIIASHAIVRRLWGVVLELIVVGVHALVAALVLEPYKVWARLVLGKLNHAAMFVRRAMIVLEAPELVAERGVLSVIPILASHQALWHAVAASASGSRRVGACSTKRRVGRCTTRNGHLIEFDL
jgi:hypothetical protein